MAINIGGILDLIKGTVGRVTGAINKGEPAVVDIVDRVGPIVDQVGTLVDIAKDLFKGKKPTPEQIAAAEKIRQDLEKSIAES